jgi:TRAP-type mannitol/chloroaromatic compound transport system permease small subunit
MTAVWVKLFLIPKRPGLLITLAIQPVSEFSTKEPVLLSTLMTIETFIRRFSLACALMLVPSLIFVRLFEIYTRTALSKPASLYSAMERELFVFFVFITLAAAYLSDAHVRVDILRDQLSTRAKSAIEILGGLFFVLPFAAIILWSGGILTISAFEHNEKAAIALGAPVRWMIIAALPVGITLLALAVTSKVMRCALHLVGKGPDPWHAKNYTGSETS